MSAPSANTEIPPDFLKIEVLGDFAKDDARVFFETTALNGTRVTNEDWQRVYEVGQFIYRGNTLRMHSQCYCHLGSVCFRLDSLFSIL